MANNYMQLNANNPLHAPRAIDVLVTVTFALLAGIYGHFEVIHIGFGYAFWFALGWMLPVDLGVSQARYGPLAACLKFVSGCALCVIVTALR